MPYDPSASNMPDPMNIDVTMEDEYDEEADSDFEDGNGSDDNRSTSSGEEVDQTTSSKQGQPKPQSQARSKTNNQAEPLELDSGDEATIQERKRAKRKQKQKGQNEQDDDGDVEEQGWRARTRAMREMDEVEKKRSRLASVRGSTIDVDKIWEAMNRPGPRNHLLIQDLAPAIHGGASPPGERDKIEPPRARPGNAVAGEVDESRDSYPGMNDMITIDETYEFAGEVHRRKKNVPKSSAEAKAWLSLKSSHNSDPRFQGDAPIRRPLRKVSRFDPNLNHLDSFKSNWEKTLADGKGSKVQKLNTVDKSKMDWAAHVDQEGLQDELSEHARAKAGYLGRMDFLGQVERRKEEEARAVRLKG